MAKLSD